MMLMMMLSLALALTMLECLVADLLARRYLIRKLRANPCCLFRKPGGRSAVQLMVREERNGDTGLYALFLRYLNFLSYVGEGGCCQRIPLSCAGCSLSNAKRQLAGNPQIWALGGGKSRRRTRTVYRRGARDSAGLLVLEDLCLSSAVCPVVSRLLQSY